MALLSSLIFFGTEHKPCMSEYGRNGLTGFSFSTAFTQIRALIKFLTPQMGCLFESGIY